MSNDKLNAPSETIDELVTEKREELNELHARFMVNGKCRCPLCKSLERTEKQYVKRKALLCRCFEHETIREDSTIKHTHSVGTDNDRGKDEYYN